MTDEKDLSQTTKDEPTVEVTVKYLDALRQAVGLHIDPETAEVDWIYAQTLDPYGDHPDLPEECRRLGGNTSHVLQEAMYGSILATCPRPRAKPCGRSTNQSWRFLQALKIYSQTSRNLPAERANGSVSGGCKSRSARRSSCDRRHPPQRQLCP